MKILVELGSLGRVQGPEKPLSPFAGNLGQVKSPRATARSPSFYPCPTPFASPSPCCPSSQTRRNSGGGSHTFLLPGASLRPEHQRPRGPGAKVPESREPGSRWLAARQPPLAPAPPSLLHQTQGPASGGPFRRRSHRPPRSGVSEVRGGHPHKGALCLALRDGQRGRGHRLLPLRGPAALLPGLKRGLPSACHDRHPHARAGGAQAPQRKEVRTGTARRSPRISVAPRAARPRPLRQLPARPGPPAAHLSSSPPLVWGSTWSRAPWPNPRSRRGWSRRSSPAARARGPAVPPGGRAPRCPCAPSRLHGRAQRVTPARPSPGHGTHRGGGSSCHRPEPDSGGSRAIAAAGTRDGDPRPPVLSSAWDPPGRPPPADPLRPRPGSLPAAAPPPRGVLPAPAPCAAPASLPAAGPPPAPPSGPPRGREQSGAGARVTKFQLRSPLQE